MSELKRFLYFRISGVSLSMIVGATLTLMCEPRRGMLTSLADAPMPLLALRLFASKPNAWKERCDSFLRRNRSFSEGGAFEPTAC